MPLNNTDPRVDAYIKNLPAWQQAICQQEEPEPVELAKSAIRTTTSTGQNAFA
jgi:hypothetical protein